MARLGLACSAALLMSADAFMVPASFVTPALAGAGAQVRVPTISSAADRRRRLVGVRMAESQDSAKKMQDDLEKEKAKLAALVSDAAMPMPEVADMMSEKGSVESPLKPAYQSSVVQPAPFKNPDFTPPPKSFQECSEQAYLSAKAAIAAGHRLLEVEFPPLPQSAMDNGAIGAYTILDAQIQHARTFARLFEDKRSCIVFSDSDERNILVEDDGKTSAGPRRPGSVRYTALGGTIRGSYLFGGEGQTKVEEVQDDDDLFIVIGASAQELPDVKALCERAGDRPVVLFNMKLQIIRGDLGLPFFPGKDLHYNWLSTAVPVYHVRPTPYTRTLSTPPYLINFSGAIFRTWPGKWQALLEVPDTDNGGGKYERVTNLDKRPALSEMRELLAEELQLDALDPQKDGKLFGIDLKTLRGGVVAKTWWEKDIDKCVSDAWRD